jgi:hypothetical protein
MDLCGMEANSTASRFLSGLFGPTGAIARHSERTRWVRYRGKYALPMPKASSVERRARTAFALLIYDAKRRYLNLSRKPKGTLDTCGLAEKRRTRTQYDCDSTETRNCGTTQPWPHRDRVSGLRRARVCRPPPPGRCPKDVPGKGALLYPSRDTANRPR